MDLEGDLMIEDKADKEKVDQEEDKIMAGGDNTTMMVIMGGKTMDTGHKDTTIMMTEETSHSQTGKNLMVMIDTITIKEMDLERIGTTKINKMAKTCERGRTDSSITNSNSRMENIENSVKTHQKASKCNKIKRNQSQNHAQTLVNNHTG